MKKCYIMALLAIICLSVKGQKPFRCLTSNSYKIETQRGEVVIRSPIAVCYYGNFFSFSTGSTGTTSFEITDRTNDNTSNVGRESFLNEENQDNMKGDYSVEITYGINKKTIVINFTKFGQAFVIESKGFLGSPEQNITTRKLIKRIKSGHSEIKKQPYFLQDVSQWFESNFDVQLKGTHSVIKCLATIDDDGKIVDIDVKSIVMPMVKTQAELEKDIVNTLKKMPLWQPAINEDGHYERSQISLTIKSD